MKRPQLIIFGVIALAVLVALGLLTGFLPGLRETGPQAQPFTLEIWGVGDPPELWQEIASAYQQKVARGATIKFQAKDPASYETELVNAMASGTGPDIFFLPDELVEKHRDKIRPLSDGMLGYQSKNLGAIFADGLVAAMASPAGELWGTPLYFDTLALLYNRDYFNSANIPQPPETWEALSGQVQALTRYTEVGSIRRSGAALGRASNVEHAADILLALLYQSGSAVIDEARRVSAISNPKTREALAFLAAFTDPTRKTYSWNAAFGNSLEAFSRGETAMAFGYAADVKRVAALNPQLNFAVAPLPQQAGSETQVHYGRFTLLAVSRLSKNVDQAWRFLLWLQSRDPQKTYIDALGLPPARRDLSKSKPPREYLVTFYDQVLSSRTLPVTGDRWLAPILDDMIESVVNRKFSVDQAVSRAANEINAQLSRTR